MTTVEDLVQHSRRGRHQRASASEADAFSSERFRIAQPAMHPRDKSLVERMGPPTEPDECWLCRHGASREPGISNNAIDEMLQLYLPRRGSVRDIDLATEMSLYFEKNIRIPANLTREGDQEEIPPLTPRMIFWHMQLHDLGPCNFLQTTIATMMDFMQELRFKLLYTSTGPNPEALKMFKTAFDIASRAYTMEPQKMFLGSNTMTVPRAAWLNPIRPIVNDAAQNLFHQTWGIPMPLPPEEES